MQGQFGFAYREDRKFYIMKQHTLPQWEIQFYTLPSFPSPPSPPGDTLGYSVLFLEQNPVFHCIGILCPEEEQNVGIRMQWIQLGVCLQCGCVNTRNNISNHKPFWILCWHSCREEHHTWCVSARECVLSHTRRKTKLSTCELFWVSP